MAVTRVASCGFETPMSESGFDLGGAGGRFDVSHKKHTFVLEMEKPPTHQKYYGPNAKKKKVNDPSIIISYGTIFFLRSAFLLFIFLNYLFSDFAKPSLFFS